MRFASLSVLLLSTVGLTACGGGSATLPDLDLSAQVCGLGCKVNPNTGGTVSTPKTASNGAGQNLPPPSTVNNGNTTTLQTGDTAILLEKSVMLSTKGTNGLVRLTKTDNTPAGADPNDRASVAIDTKDPARNGSWPTPKTMEWRLSGQSAANPVTMTGNSLSYDEYKSVNSVNGGKIAEELQIWTWNKSYAAQYRDITNGGGDASHQAWFFGAANGGTKSKATDIAVGGTLTLAGKYTGTAKTANFIVPGNNLVRTLSPNGLWSTLGDSQVTVNLDNKQVSTVLTPTHFVGEASLNGGIGERIVSLARIANNTASPEESANYYTFMSEQLVMAGTLTADANGNSVSNGVTTYTAGSEWITDGTATNFQGALFGNATDGWEFTGAYAASASSIEPYTGNVAHNNNGIADFEQSGILHAE
jgi:hypothetical protein